MAKANFIETDKALKAINGTVEEQITLMEKLNTGVVKLVTNYEKVPSGFLNAQKDINTSTQKLATNQQILITKTQTLAAVQKTATASATTQSKATREQAVAQQILRAETDRNVRANTLLGGAYAKASAQLLILKKQAKDYAIALGETHPKTLQAVKDANDLGGRIMSADKVVGDFQRNVGNYSNGVVGGFQKMFSGVRQLAYILPGIGIAGIFSLALDPLIDLIKNLDIFKEKLVGSVEARKKLTEASQEGLKSSIEERENLKLLLGVAKDHNVSLSERTIAIKKLRDEYPYYFKNLTDEQILAGNTAKAEQELNDALIARAKTQAAIGKITEVQSQVIDLELKQNQLVDARVDAEKRLKEAEKENTERSTEGSRQRIRNRKGEIASYNEEYNKISKRKQALEEVVKALEKYAQTEENTAIGLDYKETKGTQAKKEKLALTFSAIKSEYELQKAIIQRQLAEIGDRMNNDKSSLDARLKARQEFSAKSIELLDLEIKEENALLLEKYNDDLKKNNLAYKNKELTAKQYAENLQVINERVNNEQQTAQSKNSAKFNDLMNQDLAFYKKIEEEKLKFSQSTQKMIIDLEIKKFKAIVDNANGENYTLTIRQKAFEQVIRLQRAELDLAKIRELANSKSDEETANIIQKYKDLNYEIDNLQSPLQKAQKATEDWLQSGALGQLEKSLNNIGISSAKMFLDFDKNGQSTFDKLIEGADTLQEKFAVTFQAVGDVAQDAFNKIFELSNANLQNQFDNLQKEKEVAIAFAGDSASAKEEIERQYQERQRQIKRKEFQAKKEQAIFNIVLDTAQAVVEALPNYALAIAVGLIGAAELALVSSQQPPSYEFGTDNHIGGGMIINDQKGSNYKELVETPDGKKRIYEGRNVRVNAPKGTKVKTASETMDYLMFNSDLNNILTGNNIAYPKVEVNNSGISDSQVNKIVSAIENKAEFSQLISNGDLKTVVRKGNQETELMNKRVRFERKKV